MRDVESDFEGSAVALFLGEHGPGAVLGDLSGTISIESDDDYCGDYEEPMAVLFTTGIQSTEELRGLVFDIATEMRSPPPCYKPESFLKAKRTIGCGFFHVESYPSHGSLCEKAAEYVAQHPILTRFAPKVVPEHEALPSSESLVSISKTSNKLTTT